MDSLLYFEDIQVETSDVYAIIRVMPAIYLREMAAGPIITRIW